MTVSNQSICAKYGQMIANLKSEVKNTIGKKRLTNIIRIKAVS